MTESLQGYHVSLFNTKSHRLLSPGLFSLIPDNKMIKDNEGKDERGVEIIICYLFREARGEVRGKVIGWTQEVGRTWTPRRS